MRFLLALVRKDLIRRYNSPLNLLLTLLFPLVLIGVIGITFQPRGSFELPTIDLLVENHDGEWIGQLLSGAIGSDQMGEFFHATHVDSGTGEAIVSDGKASALFVIPDGFTEHLLAGEPTSIEVVKNPGEQILPEIAESFGDMAAIALSGASRLFAGPLAEARDFFSSPEAPTREEVALYALSIHDRISGHGRLLLPPAIEVVKTEIDEDAKEGGSNDLNMFAYIFPGMAALGLLFVGQAAMRDLLIERELGHVARILTSPTSMRILIVSKLVSAVILVIAANILLSAVSTVLFRIQWGNMVASILLVMAQAIAISGLIAFLYAITKTEKQADALSMVVIFGMSILGGSMMPTEFFPDTMQQMGRATLNYWAIEGFRTLLFREGGVGAIVPHLLVLGSVGVIFSTAAAFLFPRSLRR